MGDWAAGREGVAETPVKRYVAPVSPRFKPARLVELVDTQDLKR